MKVIATGTFSVYFEGKSFSALNRFIAKKKYRNYIIVCDENTLVNCLPILINACPQLTTAEIIELEPGESTKDIAVATQIWQSLLDQNTGKDSLLINLGGGVISDIGGFCASIFKRGIPFINIPTTLLSIADASIGSKTGIDFGGLKNSIGSFAHPQGVFVYRGFLQTLSSRHLMNGLAEIYKIALIADARFWNRLSEISLQEMIERSIELKQKIVEKDPFERQLRKILNFGHTLGHAIEAHALAQNEDLLHGEAIVAGMIMETHLSWQKKLISTSYRNEVIITLQLIFELPEINYTYTDLEKYMQNDKKNKNGIVSFSLLSAPGKCKPDIACSSSQISKAILYYQTVIHA